MIYLAAPYSHPDPAVRQQRYEKTLEAAAEIQEKFQQNVYAPILHNRQLAEFIKHTRSGLPSADSWEYWRRHDLYMLRHCAQLRVLTLAGWKESVGVQAEIAAAKAINLPITHFTGGWAYAY